MIRKIKTSVNGDFGNTGDNKDNNSNVGNSYENANNNMVVEELNLDATDVGTNLSNNNVTISEVSFLEAVDKNFANNKMISNEVNNQIYNSLKNKINQYITNGGNGGF